MLKVALAASLMLLAVSSANAATIINLSAGPANPNSGPSNPVYGYNPVTETLSSGTYNISVVGIAGGGLYDAWTIYAPGPGAYTDGFHLNLGNGTVLDEVIGTNYNSAADALAAYKAQSPQTFTLTSAETVSFYLNDNAVPYFADDTGGVSISLVQVPEPASLALFGAGLIGLGWMRRRRFGQAAA